MNFTFQILFTPFCQQNERKNKLKMKKSLSHGFMSVVLPSHKFGGKHWFPPLLSIFIFAESSFPLPSITWMQRKPALWAVDHLQAFGSEAGKGMFVNIVSGVTRCSCNKTHSGEKLIAQLVVLVNHFHMVQELWITHAWGSSHYFLNFILSVVLPSVVLPCCRVTPLTEW